MKSKTKKTTFDLIVVGGGISGLYFTYKYLKNHSKSKVLILESSSRLGGRILTTNYNKQKYEIGAGRFSNHHILLKELIEELNLNNKIIKLKGETGFLSKKESININSNMNSNPKLDFDSLLESTNIKLSKFLKSKEEQYLLSETLFNILKEIDPDLADKINLIYPYYSEFHIMNAKDSLNTFERDFKNKTEYFVLKDGLEQLIKGLYKKIKDKVQIEMDDNMIDLEEIESGWKLDMNSSKTYFAETVILALPKSALLELTALKPIRSLLNLVSGQPLYRIYAKFEKQWLKKKIVTDSILKFIIPINDSGLTLVSYTDGPLTKKLVQYQVENTLEAKIKEELKKLFPTVTIPKIEWIDGSGFWEVGAHYWKPRKVHLDQEKLIKKINHPFDGLYIIGEAYSSYQAWIEGALRTSEIALENIKKNKEVLKEDLKKNKTKDLNQPLDKSQLEIKSSSSLKKKPINKYTLIEVAKHNTNKDAWIVIRNKVYNISDWISRHPGGNIILKGLGKDATIMFDNFRHSPRAEKILKDYKIGILI